MLTWIYGPRRLLDWQCTITPAAESVTYAERMARSDVMRITHEENSIEDINAEHELSEQQHITDSARSASSGNAAHDESSSEDVIDVRNASAGSSELGARRMQDNAAIAEYIETMRRSEAGVISTYISGYEGLVNNNYRFSAEASASNECYKYGKASRFVDKYIKGMCAQLPRYRVMTKCWSERI